MLVNDFKVKSISAGRDNGFTTYELEINGNSISKNLPYFEAEDGLVQINACDECFVVGCASGGYVQALLVDNFIVWKEPLIQGRESYWVNHFQGSYGLKNGTIFWPIDKYKEFLNCYSVDITSDGLFAADFIDIEQAKDLWRIYGSKCYEPRSIDSSSIEWIEEQFLTMYSEERSADECSALYKEIHSRWKTGKTASLITLTDDVIKVNVIFDVIQGYREWDFACYKGNRIFLPIGDNFAIEIK